MKRSMHRQGFSLPEVLVTVALVGLVVSFALPNFNNFRRRAALRTAAREIMSELREARFRAIVQRRQVALKFAKGSGGEWMYSVYEDRDADGVRNNDIKAGVDVLVQPSRPVLLAAGGATIGLPPVPVRDPDTNKVIAAGASPIKFGKSALCSFSWLGGGTAGSIYLTDEYENVAIVRVTGATGRVRLLFYDAGSRKWS